MYCRRKFESGSTWNKWDLHIHTPASFHWNDGKCFSEMNSNEKKESVRKIITKINESDVEVFSFQDYWTFDGYFTCKDVMETEKIELKKTILPGMELRIEAPVDFRLNIHVVFPEDISRQELIDFKNTLKIGGTKEIALSDEGLKNFGSSLDPAKAKVHGFNGEYKDDPKKLFELGAKTAKITKKSLIDALQGIGRDRYMVILPYDCSDGIMDLDWKKHSGDDAFFLKFADVFESRNSDNISLFLGNKTPKNVSFLNDFLLAIGGKPKPVISGSDAHAIINYGISPHEAFTWIKANPTFKGLRQCLVEPNRTYIGKIPEKVDQFNSNKTKFISKIKIEKNSNISTGEVWFDNEVEINPELVSIIGNKGMGKSALADITGLLANSRQHSHFSFLNDKKFKNQKNYKADKFIGHLTWANGMTNSKKLDADLDLTTVEQVKYIPQSYLEKVCNDADIIKSSLFEEELEEVIFSHIDHSDRLGLGSLKELVEFKTEEAKKQIEGLHDELRDVNRRIVSLEQKCTDEHRQNITNKLTEIGNQIRALEEIKPIEVKKPDGSSDEAEKKSIEEANKKIELLAKKIVDIEAQIKDLAEKEVFETKKLAKIEKAENQIKLLTQTFQSQKQSVSDLLLELGASIDDIVTFHVNTEPIIQMKETTGDGLREIKNKLDLNFATSLVSELKIAKDQKEEVEKTLNEPNKKFQEYLQSLKEWKQKKESLEGEKDKPGTQRYFNYLLSEISRYPNEIKKGEKDREGILLQVHSSIKNLASLYQKLYAPVQKFVEEYKFESGGFQVNFNVSINETYFGKEFFEIVARNAKGSFYGKNESEKELSSLLAPVDFENSQSVIKFCNDITERLKKDFRTSELSPVPILNQLREGKVVEDIYFYIYSLRYLRPKFELKLNHKTIQELSPGERGTLLLIFYLLVDKDTRPLLIDQPEENLDNQTIFTVLVPAIKEAKKRRQIIMVTHNPNLAVVCDAEQVIVATIDKKDGNRVGYSCGAIENPEINSHIVNILEGTKPAFNNREAKYLDLE